MLDQITIRSETAADVEGISKVNDLAFKQPNEGKLIVALRNNPAFIPELSLVAIYNEEVVGHILFFPVEILGKGDAFPCLSLAPLAVIPKHQNKGIGGKLIMHGLKKAKALGYTAVAVVGHPDYYPKFGFVKSSDFGIRSPIPAPDEAFMMIEIIDGSLDDIRGTVAFPAEYNED